MATSERLAAPAPPTASNAAATRPAHSASCPLAVSHSRHAPISDEALSAPHAPLHPESYELSATARSPTDSWSCASSAALPTWNDRRSAGTADNVPL